MHGEDKRPTGRYVNAWTRLRKSLAKRGLSRTVKGIAAKLGDLWFDLRFGTDTAGLIELDNLAISSENKSRGVSYTPSHARGFLDLIGSLKLPAGSVLLDLGCGKGKMMLLASYHPFKRIVGVDFSPELCAVARDNVAIFRKRVPTTTDIVVLERDAAEYPIEDDTNVLCLFNPFDAVVMSHVMRHILASLDRRHRRIFIVYNNPVCSDVILQSGAFAEEASYVHGSSEFRVYVNRAVEADEPAASRLASEPARRPS